MQHANTAHKHKQTTTHTHTAFCVRPSCGCGHAPHPLSHAHMDMTRTARTRNTTQRNHIMSCKHKHEMVEDTTTCVNECINNQQTKCVFACDRPTFANDESRVWKCRMMCANDESLQPARELFHFAKSGNFEVDGQWLHAVF